MNFHWILQWIFIDNVGPNNFVLKNFAYVTLNSNNSEHDNKQKYQIIKIIRKLFIFGKINK